MVVVLDDLLLLLSVERGMGLPVFVQVLLLVSLGLSVVLVINGLRSTHIELLEMDDGFLNVLGACHFQVPENLELVGLRKGFKVGEWFHGPIGNVFKYYTLHNTYNIL